MSSTKERRIRAVKFKGNKGVEVHYRQQLKKGVPSDHKQTIGADPMQEFQDARQALAPFLVRILGMGDLSKHGPAVEKLTQKMNDKELAAISKAIVRNQAKSLHVDSVTLTWGEDEAGEPSIDGVKFSATSVNTEGEGSLVQPPYIHLNRATYGDEQKLRECLEELVKMALDFLGGSYSVIENIEEEEVKVEDEKEIGTMDDLNKLRGDTTDFDEDDSSKKGKMKVVQDREHRETRKRA